MEDDVDSSLDGHIPYKKSGKKGAPGRYGQGESGGQTVIVKPSRGRGRPPLSVTQNKRKEEEDQTSMNPNQDEEHSKMPSGGRSKDQRHSAGDERDKGNPKNSAAAQQQADDQVIGDIVKSHQLNDIKTNRHTAFQRFSNRQRSAVYQNMNDVQRHRFDDFMQSGLHDRKNGDKKIRDLLQEIIGGQGKITNEVALVFKVSAKMYCGQLTEEARAVQLEELALKYGGR